MTMTRTSNLLNRKNLIKALGDRDLNKKQLEAIESIVNGHAQLIDSSLSLPPEPNDMAVMTETIRSSILNTLLILENYVQPRQSSGIDQGITGKT